MRMMQVLAAALLCLGACAFEHGQPGDPGDVSGDGSGSGSDTDPEADSDGDGHSDAIDNCASVGNADQRDHDDDGRGDSCDSCPHLPDTAADTDVDGVGDACDPNPTTAGERIAFFEGFYTTVSWQPVIGANTWENETGTLRQSQLDVPYQLVRDDNPDLRDVFVDARIRVNGLNPSPESRRSTGIVLGYGDPKHYFFCGIAAAGTGAEVNAGEVKTDFWGNSEYVYVPGAFPAPMSGDWLTVQARTTQLEGSTQIDCVTHRTGVTGTAQFDAEADAAGDIGIRTNGADASFDYVFAVEVPPASP